MEGRTKRVGTDVNRHNRDIGNAQVGGTVDLQRGVNDATLLLGQHRACADGVYSEYISFTLRRERGKDARKVVLKVALIQSFHTKSISSAGSNPSMLKMRRTAQLIIRLESWAWVELFDCCIVNDGERPEK